MKHLLSLLSICILTILPITGFSQLPIKPTRTISFTTDEGSYMNVDISPDGRTLVFDLLGDLYTVPATGGNATQLTKGMAINLRPVWSPDGKRIAYISDYSGALHLNVRSISGKFHTVLGTTDEQLKCYGNIYPFWTPDGNFINIAGNTYSLAGGKIPPQNSIQNPVQFSPDGKLLYYLDSGRIYQYNRARNTSRPISPVLIRSQASKLSTDARWWVYVTDSNFRKCLMVEDLLLNTRRILVPSLYVKFPFYKSEITAWPHFSFSPDSKSLFISYGGKIHKIDMLSGFDQIISFFAHVKSDAGPFDYNTFPVPRDSIKIKYTRSANASPDGRHLVFSALNRLYIMSLPNGIPHVLIDQPLNQFQPVWSPDRKWIAYVSWSDTAGGVLWRVPSAGGQPEQLTHIPGQYQRPAWSPDGALIAVIRGEAKLRNEEIVPSSGQLEIIRVNGDPPRVIDDSVFLRSQVVFSSEGDRIIYEPYVKSFTAGLQPLLISKDLNGQNPYVLASGRIWGNSTVIQQRSISPDNRFIVYSTSEDLFLVPVCKYAKSTILFDEKQQLPIIRFAAGVDPHWEEGGKILSWSYGNRFFRIDPDKIVAAAQQKQAYYRQADSAFISVTVPPDQVVIMHVTIPHFHAHGILALRDVRIITMSGNKVIEHGTIVIKDGCFTAVGPVESVLIPAGARSLDLAGTTVMPGFVDLHLHMFPPSDIFPQQLWMYLANLSYGVTTARDPSSIFDSFGYAELLESGEMIGPRLYTVGRPILLSPEAVNKVDGIADARAVVQKRATLGATTIKQYLLPTRLQREWLLIASKQAGLNMTNEGEYIPILTLAMMKDGSSGVEHNPDWGEVYKDVLSFIAAAGTCFTPTLQVRNGQQLARISSNYWYWRQSNSKLSHFLPDEQLRDITGVQPVDTTNSGWIYSAITDAQIRHSGAYVGLGSHGNNEGIGVHNELWALQMGGLSNMEALQAATIIGAEGLGIQKNIGSIEIGKIADLLILNKNPLEDIHNSREIRYVMKDGILYDGNTLDMLWPVFKKCPDWKLKHVAIDETQTTPKNSNENHEEDDEQN